MFRLLTGRFYWVVANDEGATALQIITEMMMDPLEPATSRASRTGGDTSGISVAFDAWFARCVDRDPARRFQDATRAVEAFLRVVSTDQASRHSTEPMPLDAMPRW